MTKIFSRVLWSTCAVLFCFLISGCKEVLYSNLAEGEANEMVAVLAASNIPTARERGKKGDYAVLVDSENVALAVTVLKNAGYPQTQFLSLGDVFSTEGIIGTPFEQQARYLHAMNEELSHTITSINGIRSARVLVTSPPRGRYDRELPAARASVTIHYEAGTNVQELIPSIKLVVAYAMPNLKYEDVAVASFPAGGPDIAFSDAIAAQTPVAVEEMGISGASLLGGLKLTPLVQFLLTFTALAGIALSLILRTKRSITSVRTERKWQSRLRRG